MRYLYTADLTAPTLAELYCTQPLSELLHAVRFFNQNHYQRKLPASMLAVFLSLLFQMNDMSRCQDAMGSSSIVCRKGTKETAVAEVESQEGGAPVLAPTFSATSHTCYYFPDVVPQNRNRRRMQGQSCEDIILSPSRLAEL